MTEANWSQLITMLGVVAVPGVISCIVSCWSNWLSFKARVAATTAADMATTAALESKSNGEDIKKLRQAVDGRFTELLASTEGRAKLEGFLEGGAAEVAKAAATLAIAKGDIAEADLKTVSVAHALLETAAEAARGVIATAVAVAATPPAAMASPLELRLAENTEVTAANTVKMPEPDLKGG